MRRLEGLAKLAGREKYVDDAPMGDAWWGMTVRSSSPRGRIAGIAFGDSVDWSGLTVVDHRGLPGPNEVRLIELDQPILAAEEVRHVHEPVLLLAHPSREVLRRAVASVRIEIEEGDAVLDYLQPPRDSQLQRGPDNVLKELKIEKGDVDAAFEGAAHVVEGTYRTGAQEHVYLETNGMEAWLDGDVVTVRGSMQCPYYVQAALTHGLARDDSQVRVIQATTGGGFGGKEDYPSILALHAAVLSLACGRRVRMVYDRGEDMAATTKRHPSRVWHRTALDERGKLVAQDIEVTLDAGAYTTLSPVVLSRGIIHAAGPYSCPNVRIRGLAMLSNSVPFGAFRGFGAPQTLFAVERHLDVVANAIGLDPVDLRRRNLIRDGDTTSTGQVIDDGTDREAVLDRALEVAGHARKTKEHESFNARHPYLRRGIGLATFYHGAGFTGSGEVHLASEVHVAGLPDGRVEVRTANTEMGQGALTIFTQIAAQRLGLAPDDVMIAEPDTARVPDSGPTVASRTSMVVGKLVERACDGLLERLGLTPGAGGDEVRRALAEHATAHPGEELVARAMYERPPGIHWDEDAYQGDAYGTFAWAAYVAEVEVDLRTCGARVLDFVAVQEIGKVLNETLARGQIQGGVVQGIGWALMEECRWEAGALANNQLTNYLIPTSADVCPICVEFIENPYAHGALGAKGIGELPMDGPAPAIANAIARATGAAVARIPATPEALANLLETADVG
jgi:CO/xanthine dehydrogenase Mo-binding subunit